MRLKFIISLAVLLLAFMPFVLATESDLGACSVGESQVKICAYHQVTYTLKREANCQISVSYGSKADKFNYKPLEELTLGNGVFLTAPNSCTGAKLDFIFSTEKKAGKEGIDLGVTIEDLSVGKAIDTILSSTEEINAELRENPIDIPPAAQKVVSEGTIGIMITRLDGSESVLYIIAHDKKITGVSKTTPEEKTEYDLITDEATINSIVSSNAVGEMILSNYKDGNIKIKAHGLGNNVKLFFAKIFLKFVKVKATTG